MNSRLEATLIALLADSRLKGTTIVVTEQIDPVPRLYDQTRVKQVRDEGHFYDRFVRTKNRDDRYRR